MAKPTSFHMWTKQGGKIYPSDEIVALAFETANSPFLGERVKLLSSFVMWQASKAQLAQYGLTKQRLKPK